MNFKCDKIEIISLTKFFFIKSPRKSDVEHLHKFQYHFDVRSQDKFHSYN